MGNQQGIFLIACTQPDAFIPLSLLAEGRRLCCTPRNHFANQIGALDTINDVDDDKYDVLMTTEI
jgi:hypothetical protein